MIHSNPECPDPLCDGRAIPCGCFCGGYECDKCSLHLEADKWNRMLAAKNFYKKNLQTKGQQEFAREHGCGDNSCLLGSPGGMATNGGCMCLPRSSNNITPEEWHRTRRLFMAMSKEMRRLWEREQNG